MKLMTEVELMEYAPSAQTLIEWFGCMPNFHDAEIIGVKLNRSAESHLRIHTFRTLSSLNQKGHYETDRHAIVHVRMRGVSDSVLTGFNDQNVVSGVFFEKTDEGCKMTLGGCHGLEGFILAKTFTFGIEAGIPENSVYS